MALPFSSNPLCAVAIYDPNWIVKWPCVPLWERENTMNIGTKCFMMWCKDLKSSLDHVFLPLQAILYQQHVLPAPALFTTEKSFFSARSSLLHVHSECSLTVKSFPSCLILLSSALQRALSPRVPANGCLCLEASNNCSSRPPSLFVSYRGSASSVSPVPLCLEGYGG